VPISFVESALDVLLVFARSRGAFPLMAQLITAFARSGDIAFPILPAILASNEMLSRALKVPSLG
jgi:hypothetical protein